MGKESRYRCLVETRKILLLMGVVFGIILFIQFFELPYTNVFSSLFPTEKSQTPPLESYPSTNSSSSRSPTNSRIPTYFSSTNSTNLDVANGASNTTKKSDRNDFDREKSKNSDDSLNDDIDPEDESPFKDFPEMDHNSTVAWIPLNDSFPLEKSRETHHESLETSSPITSTGKDEKVNDENPKAKKSAPVTKETEPAVVTISKMNDMLKQSRVSYKPVKTKWPSTADQELLSMTRLIENASFIGKDPHFDANLYRNFSEFKRSYELMEQTLKVYVYAEGERPIFHQPPLKGIYASEGWFMKLLKSSKRFVTKNPKKAHLFYLPFSSRNLEITLYVPNSHSRKNLIEHLSNYVEIIRSKYNFWNRTNGADHFLVACHDWAPAETKGVMANCIRAMCNADIGEGFKFGKDVSLPETSIRSPQNLLRELGGKPPSQRKILAFFAGNMHGYLRPILLKYWENKDPDMKIFGRIRKSKGEMSYAQYMKSSKYCICAKGFEVNSPRVVEAIFFECVPVIVSDNFVPPFFETLKWESFAVFVMEKDIPNLKNILSAIPKRRYVEMQRRVKMVQQHFLWHSKPVKYDVFHMILHSIWYNRVFQIR
ncbi:hypothetical protein ABFS82_01G020500 [Erythranthe guttata]|uniref:Exostosin GT47 domain-containing protein n=1 Tax=Erythranthe guttata TaxID=4155 RepID=A0A022Q002_ERYGU|nr:PREDICTED: probable glycosyltransferase At5g03795 [Erythranthe guttata]EYU20438.1 hypothetical protein MIMGU_mgv1a003254mg [Erythranthe guttata]|eukprot:XP_012857826.1 PREDICTED: probable glycosyltransferase At5g03795 [Erythranthe guttata]